MGAKVCWQEREDAALPDWEDVREIAIGREFNDAIRGAVEDDSPWYRKGVSVQVQLAVRLGRGVIRFSHRGC
jgi:hypothetical protein